MTEEQIKAAARAICAERCAYPFGDPPCWSLPDFDGCKEDDECRTIAKAALAAAEAVAQDNPADPAQADHLDRVARML